MKRLILVLSVMLTAAGPCGVAFLIGGEAAAQDLPPEILVDQYMLEAKRALEDTVQDRRMRWQTAISAFRKIEALNVEPPLEYLYFYGRFLVEEMERSKDLLKGQSLLQEYAIKGGRESKHYTSTLELLSSSTEKIKKAYGWDLIQHAGKGELQKVKSLISAGADVNAKNDADRTPLHRAADNGHAVVVRVLIAEGADVNAKDDLDRTALYGAVWGGHLEVINALITAGAYVNAKEGNLGETPLHRAAKRGHVEAVNALIAAGADVNAFIAAGGKFHLAWGREGDVHTPLHLAAVEGHLNVVRTLIAAGADVNAKDKDGYAPLHYAAWNGHAEVVKALIVADAVADAGLLHRASKGDDNGEIDDLIGRGADVDAFRVVYGKASIYMAAYYGNTEVVKALIAAGDDVNFKSKSKFKWRPLNAAGARGHLEVVKALIAANADVNKGDIDGDRPLHQAAYSGHAEVVRMLIAAGADVNKKNNAGERPLKFATENGHAEVARILKAAGAKK